MFNKSFQRPAFRPSINVGCMFDIPTGKYETGKRGEQVLNGGLGPLTGIASRPNNFKSAIGVFFTVMVRRAMPRSDGITYDTEGTLDPTSRYKQISDQFSELTDIDWDHDEQFMFTDLSRYSGDEFFSKFREVLGAKAKDEKTYIRTTPFLDMEGKPRQCLYPTTGFIDSFSKFIVSDVDKMYEKNKIGDSKNNTDAMMNGKAKNQLFNQLPQVCAKTGSYVILTAHVGDIIQMEMYPTDKRNLSHMKKDTVLKGVSGGFYSLPNNVFSIESNKPMLNKEKMPQYPLDNATAMEGDTDLRELTIMNLRGKAGMSGLPFKVIVSQTEGLQVGLTDFDYVKENGFGIGGNALNYFIELRPEVNLSRTKVRQIINGDAKLRRACEFQSEMLQLVQFQRWTSEYICDPKVLYEDLKAMGYDWDVLLDTRGYWMCEEDEKEPGVKPFLSTFDLLKMRKFEYVPFWFTKEQKAAIKPLELATKKAA
jgi:hypothetical protein